jgi:hypothetical protein
MLPHLTEDVFDSFSPVKILLKSKESKNINYGENNIIIKVTKKIRELDKILQFNIFPTKTGS